MIFLKRKMMTTRFKLLGTETLDSELGDRKMTAQNLTDREKYHKNLDEKTGITAG